LNSGSVTAGTRQKTKERRTAPNPTDSQPKSTESGVA
jgi:hypothetical protein